ncbi:MAG: IS1380 family transposase [Blastocatellia bacterium]|nr:IS1380 family transposase [Blastocatellia bacterium]
MSRTYPKILRNCKNRIERRLAPKNWEDQPRPMFKASNIHYEMAERVQGINCGGIGAMHLMVQGLGLVKDIDRSVELLKVHLPYHESDHVLNIAYNILAGGVRLEDIELRRQDENFLNGLGAQRIPDPTTAGDFTRRFQEADILSLQECFNRARLAVWKVQPQGFLNEAFIDVDGTIAGTQGECKEGIGLSYKGIWGYAPLIISLANTKEVLYLLNRPGQAASQSGSVEWIDRAVEWVLQAAGAVTIRGDTDFSHTEQLDRWNGRGIKFVFGIDAHPKLVKIADELAPSNWKRLERLPKYEILSEPRQKAFRYKEQIVIEKEFKNRKLVGEDIAEIQYQPLKCGQKYRVVIVRKNISVQKGEKALLDEIKYFFYITNRKDKAKKIVGLANDRCDQENVIEQLKNGVNAMRMPVHDLLSNWAYMVMTALAWNLKSWYGLLMPNRERGLELVKMEFRRFLHAIMLIPCQIVRTARRVIYRVLGYNSWLADFFATWERLQKLVLVE